MRCMMMRKSRSHSYERRFRICKRFGSDLNPARMSLLIRLRTTSMKERNASSHLKDGQDIKIWSNMNEF